MTTTEILRAAIVSLLLCTLFALAECWRALCRPPVEQTRKLVHFGAGAICLSFVYLFQWHWTVLALCIGFVTIMFVTARLGWLQSVHGVTRSSSGSYYYPLAVWLTFLVTKTNDQPVFYLISILVLAISDSLAALVGGRYGFKLYHVEEDRKSLEGSIGFFAGTFLIVHLCLLLLTPTGRAESVLIALYLAILVTAFESVSLLGADNIFIPLGTAALLLHATHLPLSGVVREIAIIVVMFATIGYFSRRIAVFGLTAVIGLCLFGYAAWVFGGWPWTLPPLISFSLFTTSDLFIEGAENTDARYRIRSVFYVLIVSFIWLLAAGFVTLRPEIFFVSFVVNLTASLGIFWQRRSRLNLPYRLPLPDWLRHAPLMVRAGMLTPLLVIPTTLADSRIDRLFTLLAVFSGTICVEAVYWHIEKCRRGIWSNMQFLQATALITLGFTVLATVASLLLYRIDFPADLLYVTGAFFS